MFLILLAAALVAQAAGEIRCEKKLDLAFVIDSSTSIWRPDFETQKAFVQQIVKLFNVAPDQARVAALTFGHEVDYEFNFNDYRNVDAVVSRIGKIPHKMGVSTHTALALAGMRENLFSPRNGARPDVDSICIVLTDGASSDRLNTIAEANLAKQAGIELFAIGIGNSTNRRELEEMVSSPVGEHLFMVPSFGDLDTDVFRGKVLDATCDVIRPTTRRVIIIPTQPPTICRGKEADIVFIVDRSSSIWLEDFKTQLRFLADVISQFDVEGGNTQVSMITFSDTATVEFYLNRYSSVQQMRAAILAVESTGGITNTHLALEMMLTDVFSVANGYRPNVAHICIVITDGASTFSTLTQQMSMLVHDAGIITFAIGVGSERDVDELKIIASKPSSNHVFEVDGYQALPEIKQIITDRTCEVPATVKPPENLVCQGKEADIVFIVDRSSSIWLEDFKTQMKFLADVISQFDVDSGRTRVSLITFSDEATVEFYLNRYSSVQQMRAAILAVQSQGGITNTHLALKAMLQDVLTERNGYRPGVPHICIVITDGASTYPELTRQMTQQTHGAGIITFAIGVGDLRDVEELKIIASKPSSNHMFEVDGYQALPEIKQIITDRTCGVPTTVVKPEITRCEKSVDLAFVIDGSTSIWRPDFELQKKFVQQIVKLFSISPDQTRVAALTFGSKVDYEFNFNEYQTLDQVVDRIGKIPHSMGESTHTYLALAGMRENIFSPSNGARSNVEHICIVFTDGASSDKYLTITEASLAKQAGIELFAIGIGNNTNRRELEEMVSAPIDYHLFMVPSYGALDTQVFRQELLDATCNEVTRSYKTRPPRPLTARPRPPRTTTRRPLPPRLTTTEPFLPPSTWETRIECLGVQADVVFLVDRSSSIWLDAFINKLLFVSDVLSQFDVASDRTRVSLVTYSDTPRVEFYLNQYSSADQLRGALLSVGSDEGAITNTHLALRTVLADVFTVQKGYRPEVPQICIVLTDSVSDDPFLMRQESLKAHDAGIYTFAIGVGELTDRRELKQLASRPIKDFVIEVDGYDALPQLAETVASRSCQVPAYDGLN